MLARKFGREAQILAGELEREADAIEVTLEDHLRQRTEEHPLTIRAIRDRGVQRFGGNARLHAHREGLGQNLHAADRDHVMDQLGDRARADRTNVRDLVADPVERRLDLVVDLLVAADHHGQCRIARARDAAADGRIEHRDTFFSEGLLQAPDQCRRIGREIRIDRSLADPVDNRVLAAERDGLDLFGSGERREHELCVFGRIGGSVGPLRAARQMGIGHALADIVDGQAVASLDQIKRHRAAHIAESDKSNSHRSFSRASAAATFAEHCNP